jgi:hypothetical protein
VTPDDEHTEAERERSEARGAELRSELAATDARRAEEDTAKAEQEAKQAQERAEKLSRKEQKARAHAEQAERTAQREREEAETAERREREAAGARGTGPASTAAYAASPPQAGADRPEILVGAAFAGAFIFARVLKRLVD